MDVMPFDDFDRFAESYVERSSSNLYNARYERPAMRAMLPDVRSLRVLDAACSGGESTEWLLAHGAQVVALDASPKMIEIARRRLGDRAQIRQADIGEPLSFLAGASIDVVFSSLTLHYLEDWRPTLREFHRILKPAGLLLFSTHHPCMGLSELTSFDYFATTLVDDRWAGFESDPVRVRYYRRPLTDVVSCVTGAGFILTDLIEPRLSEKTPDTRDEDFKRLSTQPWFLIIGARKRTG